MTRGSTPATALVTTRASGVRLYLRTASSDAISRAEAPSLIPDELPAVTLPPLRNAGFNFASASVVVVGRMNSSVSTTFGSPRFCGTSTGVISRSKRRLACADAAFCCERQAKTSCSCRVTPKRSATFSAVSPIESTPYRSRIRGFTNRQPMLVSKSCTSRANGCPDFDMTYGARVMLSTPPAT
jgi:hypothetical protein